MSSESFSEGHTDPFTGTSAYCPAYNVWKKHAWLELGDGTGLFCTACGKVNDGFVKATDQGVQPLEWGEKENAQLNHVQEYDALVPMEELRKLQDRVAALEANAPGGREITLQNLLAQAEEELEQAQEKISNLQQQIVKLNNVISDLQSENNRLRATRPGPGSEKELTLDTVKEELLRTISKTLFDGRNRGD